MADVLLASILQDIEANDTDYDVRYGLVLQAVHLAHVAGYRAGFSWDFSEDDPDLDGRRVVAYIVLPQGQVSWHMREFTEPWDGHSTEEKYSRINAFAAAAETEKRN